MKKNILYLVILFSFNACGDKPSNEKTDVSTSCNCDSIVVDSIDGFKTSEYYYNDILLTVKHKKDTTEIKKYILNAEASIYEKQEYMNLISSGEILNNLSSYYVTTINENELQIELISKYSDSISAIINFHDTIRSKSNKIAILKSEIKKDEIYIKYYKTDFFKGDGPYKNKKVTIVATNKLKFSDLLKYPSILVQYKKCKFNIMK